MPGKIVRRYVREDGSVRLTVREEGDGGDTRRTYSLPGRCFTEWGEPEPGDAVGDEALIAFREAEGQMKATAKAVHLLSYGDNSAKGLFRKLRAHGYTREDAEAAVARMMEAGYIREEEQAYRLAVTCANTKLWGPRRITAYLRERGYGGETARLAIARATEEGEIDFAENKQELLRKKVPDGATPQEKRGLLYRYGY